MESENYKTAVIGHEGQEALREGFCPYCETDETHTMFFVQESGRQGGFLDCEYCKVLMAWIDEPFEATELFYGKD